MAVISGKRYQKEKPRVRKGKETATSEEAGPSGTAEGAVPLIDIHDYSQLLPTQQVAEEGGQGQDGDDEPGSQNRLNKSDDVMEVESVASEADSASLTGGSIPDLESNPDSRGMYRIILLQISRLMCVY